MTKPRPAPSAVTRFVVTGMPRSGSMLLVEALNQHPDILCCHELFHPDIGTRRFFDLVGAVYLPGTDAAAFLTEHIYTAEHKERYAAVGFKLLYDQAAETNVWDFLEDDEDIIIIRLIRENLLECLVSGLIAERTGRWYSYSRGDESFPGPKGGVEAEPAITISPHECRSYLEGHESLTEQAARRFADHKIHDVRYHDLAEDFRRTMNGVVRALGLPEYEPVMQLKKLATRPIRDRIANYRALAEHFRGTRFAPFFHDEEASAVA